MGQCAKVEIEERGSNETTEILNRIQGQGGLRSH